jgi:hypothetical protein
LSCEAECPQCQTRLPYTFFHGEYGNRHRKD